MLERHLIINADGYGFTAGITKAIEECIAFGTVKSISVNVNFPHAERLAALVERFPDLSVGCHLNPVVGKPVLPPEQVPSLVNANGEFLYHEFVHHAMTKKLATDELHAELTAQIEKVRNLAGAAFSHVDFHMNLHLIPTVFPTFLDVVKRSGAGRIRTYRRLTGMETRFPRLRHCLFLLQSPLRLPKQLWYLYAERIARRRGLAMPDRWVGTTARSAKFLTLQSYLRLLDNLPRGYSEFVVHPGYIDDELRRHSTYLTERELELHLLLSEEFRDGIDSRHIHLAGYRDIPTASSQSADAQEKDRKGTAS